MTFKVKSIILGSHRSSVKTTQAPFGKTWATFYFNIWSHCSEAIISSQVKEYDTF